MVPGQRLHKLYEQPKLSALVTNRACGVISALLSFQDHEDCHWPAPWSKRVGNWGLGAKPRLSGQPQHRSNPLRHDAKSTTSMLELVIITNTRLRK